MRKVEDDSDASRSRSRLGFGSRRRILRTSLITGIWVAAVLLLLAGAEGDGPAAAAEGAPAAALEQADGTAPPLPWSEAIPPATIAAAAFLLVCSAFFSASEVAYFSLQRTHLGSMRDGKSWAGRLAAQLMQHPGSLLTSILMSNSIVNVLLSVVVAAPVERMFEESFRMPPTLSYPLAVAVTTFLLVFFGEITPKVLVVRTSQAYATAVAPALFLVDKGLGPLRNGMIAFTAFLFRLTRFSEMRPAPFITDDEFKALLSEGEASGVLESDERQMIQGLLELRDVTVGEILVPRPDVVALPEEATVGEALERMRENALARIPVYREDLDHITGVLHTKDLIPSLTHHDLDRPVKPLVRKALFVPETMSVDDLVKTAQRQRKHLAVVVDEYGGTEGIVTLQDALREVVGDVGEDEAREPEYTALEDGRWRVAGGFGIDELEELTGVEVDDEEHTTVGGFVMDRLEKVPEVGDSVEVAGVRYRVERVDGKRVERLLVERLDERGEAAAAEVVL